MDEWMLNDLLECSVCLERLDTSSKVLPCQHTFCKKCLLEIVDSHKELRCPECRVLVDVGIDELPPNVLLMRILEGMKNAPKKRVSGSGGAKMSSHGIVAHGASAVAMQHHGLSQHHSSAQQHQAHLASVQHHHVASPAHIPSSRTNVEYTSPKQVIVPGQACARAMYSYTSPESGDLSFKKGDLIILKKKVDANWYHGECNGNRGVFPSVYVEILTPLPSPVPQCKALYDFRMTTDEEEGCLTFNKGEVISVIRRVDENWAEGKLADRIGIFPLAFVELNQVARALMKLSSNSQPGPSRVAPPTPTSEETTPLIPTAEHTATATSTATSAPSTVPAAVAPHVLHRLGGSVSSSSQSPSSSTTPNSSSTSCSSPSSTAPSSPASPPPQPVYGGGQQQASQSPQLVQADHPPAPHPRGTSSTSPLAQPPPQQHREKRHSLNLLHAANPTNTHRLSGEIPSHSDLVTQQAEQFLASAQNSGRSHRHRRSVSDQPPAPNTANSTSQVSQTSVQLPALYVAMYPYKPQKADELELKKGALYMVTEKCQDGWFKGSAQGAHKSGVFPGNYVALAKTQAHGTGSTTSGGGPRGGGGGSRSNSHNSAASPSTWSRPFSSNSGSNTQQQSGRQSKSNSNPTGASERPYMDIARSMLAAAQAAVHNVTANQQSNVVHTPNKTSASHTNQLTPPELPPRAASPAATAAGLNSSGISSSWHAQPSTTNSAAGVEPTVAAQVTPLGRSQSHSMVGVSTTVTPPPNVTVMASPSQPRPTSDKTKEKKSSGLIRRLTTMKKSKSPPPTTYSMDNPVFEDGACINGISPSGVVLAPTCAVLQPTHARSGSCPSQLLQQFPSSDNSSTPCDPTPSSRHHHRSHHHTSATVTPSSSLFSSGSQRVKHKERANIVTANPALFSRPTPLGASSSGSSEASANSSAILSANHRKSSSLDASAADPGKKPRQLFPAVKERFRCIVPYPPNSEYELALQVGDVIHVHKKRDDGWYKGTQERTGRTGLFPASFVEAL